MRNFIHGTIPALRRTALLATVAAVGGLSLSMGTAPMMDRSQFEIMKGEDVVGRIVASRNAQGPRTTYLMTSHSEFTMLWKQVVRTTTVAEYSDGLLHTCHANLWINGSMRDSSHMQLAKSPENCYVHPDRRFVQASKVEWTTARMYFDEPLGITAVFVESVLEHCRLLPLGNHRYRLYLPDSKVNDYTYRNGVLEEIAVDRKLVDLVFRRV
ncbi:MAG: DUF6134 family protein [Flavobacteriales bacterium]